MFTRYRLLQPATCRIVWLIILWHRLESVLVSNQTLQGKPTKALQTVLAPRKAKTKTTTKRCKSKAKREEQCDPDSIDNTGIRRVGWDS
ncbi:hypothetical protein RRG08_042233 [Elysia crispata]|uniref:Secreted protein n=1 Tax=Elysia crispata TaxID=231223 RepID=A0AAE1E4J8_9GAST|nr:hypothetical protein RRG08_042233 [Elysia crispata]